jgi:hypothetical protein
MYLLRVRLNRGKLISVFLRIGHYSEQQPSSKHKLFEISAKSKNYWFSGFVSTHSKCAIQIIKNSSIFTNGSYFKCAIQIIFVLIQIIKN